MTVLLSDADVRVEICTEHQRIGDETCGGRLLKAGPLTADQWSAGFPGITDTTRLAAGRGGGTKAGQLNVRAGAGAR